MRRLIAPYDAGVLAAFAQLLGAVRAGGDEEMVADAIRLVLDKAQDAVRETLQSGPVVEDIARYIYAAEKGRYAVWDELTEVGRSRWLDRAVGVVHIATGGGS